MPSVSIIAGPGAGQRYDVHGARTTIGRDAANHIQIADPKSSRVHAEIVAEGGRYQVRDLDSSNGTWSDQGRISSLPLIDGAEFRIGATRFRFTSFADTPAEEWADPSRLQGLDQAKTVLFTSTPAGDAETLARTNAYLVLLHHLIRRSNAAQDRDALFELLDDAAAEVLDGDRCAVFLPDDAAAQGWRLWPAHERRLRARFGAVPFARTLLTTVRRDGEPLLCTSDGDLRPSQSMVQSGVRSAMAAPVRLGATVHALLYVDRLGADEPFTRSDLEFLAAVATQIAGRLTGQAPLPTPTVAPVVSMGPPPVPDLLGDDPTIVTLRVVAERLALSDVPVLLAGAAGTGKELLARRIHAYSPRSLLPFQVVACAQAATQLEAVLFGRTQAPGVFELADGGTVFLDDLAALPTSLHAALVRLLDRGELQRPGATTVQHLTVRVIAAVAATSDVPAGLGAVFGDALELPPLRARAGDITLLADAFLARGTAPHHLTPEARALLLRHPWPGNVRELRHVLEQAVARAFGRQITADDLPESLRHASTPLGDAPIQPLAAVEKAHILRVLEHCGGNKKAAAELLEIDRSTLYAKLKQYGVG